MDMNREIMPELQLSDDRGLDSISDLNRFLRYCFAENWK